MTFKPGDIAYLKLAGDPVFVLATKPANRLNFTALVEVRRPVATRDGIEYKLEEFYAEELETLDDKNGRDLEELDRKRKLWEAQMKASQQTGQLELFPQKVDAETLLA